MADSSLQLLTCLDSLLECLLRRMKQTVTTLQDLRFAEPLLTLTLGFVASAAVMPKKPTSGIVHTPTGKVAMPCSTTGIGGPNLALVPGTLVPGTRYTFTLSVVDPSVGASAGTSAAHAYLSSGQIVSPVEGTMASLIRPSM